MMIIQAALAMALGTLVSPSTPLQVAMAATAGDLKKSARKVEKSLAPVHKAILTDNDYQAEVTTRYDVKVNQCDISWSQNTVILLYQDGKQVLTSTGHITGRFGFEHIERISREQTVKDGDQVFTVYFGFGDSPADQRQFKYSMAMTEPGSVVDQPPMEAAEKIDRVDALFNEQKAADRAYAALNEHHALCTNP